MEKRIPLFYRRQVVQSLNDLQWKTIADGSSKNVVFWTLHVWSLIVFLLPVYSNTTEIFGFTHTPFHKALALANFGVTVVVFGILRTLLNRFISWGALRARTFLIALIIIISVGMLYHFLLVTTKVFIDVKLYKYQSIPNIVVGQYQYLVIHSVIHTLLWGGAFFALKMMINFNQDKLTYIAMDIKHKELKINAMKRNINPDFLVKSLKKTEEMIPEDVQKAREQLSKLSEILRYTLNTQTKRLVSWQEELQMIDNYFRHKIKHQEHAIDYSIQILDAMPKVMVPPLVIYGIVNDVALSAITSLRLVSSVRMGVPQLQVILKINPEIMDADRDVFYKNLQQFKATYSDSIAVYGKQDYEIIHINLEKISGVKK